jgi:hypothetical protein
MAMYNVCAVCNACGDLHTTGISVSLIGGPASKQSIEEAFANKDPPPNIAELKEKRVHCPKMGRQYAQRDGRKIFLIPIR